MQLKLFNVATSTRRRLARRRWLWRRTLQDHHCDRRLSTQLDKTRAPLFSPSGGAPIILMYYSSHINKLKILKHNTTIATGPGGNIVVLADRSSNSPMFKPHCAAHSYRSLRQPLRDLEGT